MKSELVVGRVPVTEALRAGKRPARKLFLLAGGKGLDEIRHAASGVPLEHCNRRDLDKKSQGTTHQGVVLEAGPLPVFDADQWSQGEFSDGSTILVLDGIEDPHNFGAIVRSAAACGADAVVFAKDRSAPISPASVKSAAGGMEYVDLVRATNLVRAVDGLKESGFWIVALDAAGEKTLWEIDLGGRVALVVGSEGKGIRRLLREHCDMGLRIPITGPITSLNASVSAAVALMECCRRRES